MKNPPNKDNIIQIVLKNCPPQLFQKKLCIKIVRIIKFMVKIIFQQIVKKELYVKSCVYRKVMMQIYLVKIYT